MRASLVWRVARVWKERARRMMLVQWRRWKPVVAELKAALAAMAARVRLAAATLVRQIRERLAAPQRSARVPGTERTPRPQRSAVLQDQTQR